MPWEAVRWFMVKQTGWRLEYIDELDTGAVLDFLSVQRGQKVASE